MPPSHGYRFGSETRFGPYEILDLIGSRRHGRGLSRPRHAPRPDRRDQGPGRRRRATSTGAGAASSARRAPSPASAIRTSAPSTTSATRTASTTSSWSTCRARPWRSRLDRRALRLDHALQYAVEIASALAEAHRAGIVHRDLKPGNVMLTPVGREAAGLRPGQAAAGRGDRGLEPRRTPSPRKGQLVGTLPYMSPEQVEGKEADARSDIFSFGLDAPRDDDPPARLRRKPGPPDRGHPVLRPAAALHAPGAVPARARPCVARCLAKDPGERWQSARDLLLELKWAAVRPAAIDGPRKRSLRALALGGGSSAGRGADRGGLAPCAWRRGPAAQRPPRAGHDGPGLGVGARPLSRRRPDRLRVRRIGQPGHLDRGRHGAATRSGSPTIPRPTPIRRGSPDGSALAFTSDRGGRSAIWKVLRLRRRRRRSSSPTPKTPPSRPTAARSRSRGRGRPASAASGSRRMSDPGAGEDANAATTTASGTTAIQPSRPTAGRSATSAQRDLWLVTRRMARAARRLTKDDE